MSDCPAHGATSLAYQATSDGSLPYIFTELAYDAVSADKSPFTREQRKRSFRCCGFTTVFTFESDGLPEIYSLCVPDQLFLVCGPADLFHRRWQVATHVG
jgi:hypothetical protein